MTTYTTKDGDTVDEIAWRFYGNTTATAQILEANKGLADYGPLLPAGVVVTMPTIATTSATEGVHLWT